MNDKTRYFRDLDGNILKTVIVGYDVETEEQYVALVDMKSGNVWMMPMVNLRRKKLVKGYPTFVYEELFDYKEGAQRDDRDPRRYEQREDNYPGYTNDPRVGQVQKFNRRYSR